MSVGRLRWNTTARRRSISAFDSDPTPRTTAVRKPAGQSLPTARIPAPTSSDEAIPVYPVRGADASHGGAAGVEIRAEMGQEGVSAMANQGSSDREGDGVDRCGFLRGWDGRGRELRRSARKA